MKYLYQIIGTAVHSETEEQMMIYQALYGDQKMYARPYNMFCEPVDHEKYPEIKQAYRFQMATQDDLNALKNKEMTS